jgi:hypothetical protein
MPTMAPRFQPCENGCGTMITYQSFGRDDRGNYIPMEEDTVHELIPHFCPLKAHERRGRRERK